jgi:replicative DNA helicase
MNRRKKIDFIIIDYLQLCYTKDRKGRNREQEIAEISRKCKEMAKELNCPILALSQMSRSVEQGNRKPRLSDLRESGAIEQDADMVLFIHHENELNQLIIAKNRNGQIEDLNLKFIPSKQIWTNYDGNFTNSFVNYKPIQTDSPF